MFGFFAMQSCKDESPVDKPDTTDTTGGKDTTTVIDTLTYTNDIKAVFDANCALSGCHNSGSSVGSLASYSSAKTMVSAGRLLGAIKHESGFSAMPKNASKLADSTITNIETWINQGVNE